MILIIAFAKSAFNLSKTGSPRPTGQFWTFIFSFAPIESPSLMSSSKNSSSKLIFDLSGKKNLFSLTNSRSTLSADILPICYTKPLVIIPFAFKYFLATAPAATRIAVSLALDLPPPL